MQSNSFDKCGFYINEFNPGTALHYSLISNRIHEPLNYFSNPDEIKNYNKILYPIRCGFDFFDDYERTIKPIRNTIEKYNFDYFFDLSDEAIPYDIPDSYLSQKLKSFHEMLEHHSIDPNKVYFVNSNLVADKHYDNWRKNLNIPYRIENKLLTHQRWLGGYSDAYTAYFSRNNIYQKNIELAEYSMNSNVKRNYYFTCLMLRPRFHRTAIMLHLLERGLMDKGIISYFGNDFGGKEVLTVDEESVRFNIISQFKSGKRLVSVWDQLNQMSPIMIDGTNILIKQLGWAPQELGFFPRDFIECISLNSRSYFEIAVETHFSDESCLYMTEKTIWPIVSLQPFITVGSPFTLEHLRNLGFETFSPYIDESYDKVTDPKARIELIFAEIDKLCSMSHDEIHNLYRELWPRLLHNYYMYFKRSKELAIKEMRKRILEPIFSD